jgi:hypothetical protein
MFELRTSSEARAASPLIAGEEKSGALPSLGPPLARSQPKIRGRRASHAHFTIRLDFDADADVANIAETLARFNLSKQSPIQ